MNLNHIGDGCEDGGWRHQVGISDAGVSRCSLRFLRFALNVGRMRYGALGRMVNRTKNYG